MAERFIRYLSSPGKMSLEIFLRAKMQGNYLQVGTYKQCPIYVGRMPNAEWVAMTTDDGKGICINRSAFAAISRSPRMQEYLESICEHEISMGACPRSRRTACEHRGRGHRLSAARRRMGTGLDPSAVLQHFPSLYTMR